jgi:hypothetical protein
MRACHFCSKAPGTCGKAEAAAARTRANDLADHRTADHPGEEDDEACRQEAEQAHDIQPQEQPDMICEEHIKCRRTGEQGLAPATVGGNQKQRKSAQQRDAQP